MVHEWCLVADSDRDAATIALRGAVEELERRGLAVWEPYFDSDYNSGFGAEIEICKGTEIPKVPSLEAAAAVAEALASIRGSASG